MRHFTSILVFTFWAVALSAQVQWLSPSNKWVFYRTFGSAPEMGTETLEPGGEIYSSGKIYRRLLHRFKDASGNTITSDERYLRQEGRKLYAKTPDNSNEFLMYDFSLAVGDTVYIPLPDNSTSGYGYVVMAISTVTVGSTQRSAQTVRWINKPPMAKADKSVLVEGIGAVQGTHVIGGADCLTESYLFLDEPSTLPEGGMERVFCNYSSPEGNFEGLGNTFCATLPTNAPLAQQIQVRPSIGTGQIQIIYEVPDAPVQVQLFDWSGRLIQEQTIIGSGLFETTYKGMGLLQISANQGRMVQKVVLY